MGTDVRYKLWRGGEFVAASEWRRGYHDCWPDLRSLVEQMREGDRLVVFLAY